MILSTEYWDWQQYLIAIVMFTRFLSSPISIFYKTKSERREELSSGIGYFIGSISVDLFAIYVLYSGGFFK